MTRNTRIEWRHLGDSLISGDRITMVFFRRIWILKGGRQDKGDVTLNLRLDLGSGLDGNDPHRLTY